MLATLLAILQLVLLVLGPGGLMKRWLNADRQKDALVSLAQSCAFGMTFLAFTGYFLSNLGSFTNTAARIGLLASSGAFVFLALQSLTTVSRPVWNQLRPGGDTALAILMLPTLILAGITPITQGDGLYSFNTWAMHWALRSDMSDYLFLAYGQLMPIVASWSYKLATWSGGIPTQQYVLHAFYALAGVLGLFVIRRIPETLTEHRAAPIIGFICAALLFLQEDVFASLGSGRAEPIAFLFQALILLDFARLYKSGQHGIMHSARIGVLVSGLIFIKPSVVPLALMSLIVLYSLEIRANALDAPSLREFFSRPFHVVRAVALKSLSAPLLAGSIVIALAGPFYAVEHRFLGERGYSNPANHSPGGSSLLRAGLTATADMKPGFSSNAGTDSSVKLFAYRMSEVFMLDSDRRQPLWGGVGISQILLLLIIAVSNCPAFVWHPYSHAGACLSQRPPRPNGAAQRRPSRRRGQRHRSRASHDVSGAF